MTTFAWIIITASLMMAGWHARGIWDFWCEMDESGEDR